LSLKVIGMNGLLTEIVKVEEELPDVCMIYVRLNRH
jgi:hypothetical protein